MFFLSSFFLAATAFSTPISEERIELIQQRMRQVESRIIELRARKSVSSPTANHQVPFQWVQTISFAGLAPGQLLQPKGITVTAGGIFVANVGNKRIEHFSLSGKFIQSFSQISFDRTLMLKAPVGIVHDNRDNLIVLDRDNEFLVFFQSTGNATSFWGGLGVGKGKFNQPQGLARDVQGNVFVADTGNDRIQKFSPNGACVAMTVKKGDPSLDLVKPVDVAVDQTGAVYVVEQGSKRIRKLNSRLQYLQDISSSRWKHPVAVKTDVKDRIYVVDSYTEKVYIHAGNGRYLSEISMGMKSPQSVFVKDDLVYITDAKLDQVLVYRIKD